MVSIFLCQKGPEYNEARHYDFLCRVYEHAYLARGINCTFVALIPKVDGAATFSEYKPISMVGCIYKILAKILRKVLPSMIGEALEENRFLMGS